MDVFYINMINRKYRQHYRYQYTDKDIGVSLQFIKTRWYLATLYFSQYFFDYISQVQQSKCYMTYFNHPKIHTDV